MRRVKKRPSNLTLPHKPTKQTRLKQTRLRKPLSNTKLEKALKTKQISYLVPAIGALLLCVANAPADAQSGLASVYSVDSGARTASGARLNPGALTAAHRTLPFGSHVRVTNRTNGRSVVVTITDRGPFMRGRIIDLTPAAARTLGFSGLASVTVERE